ncbi:geraniol 8-hydroxylase-like [Solanum verrucosum]|uniref:geraniol 8-hydroxylase-like n=1 Tax=Solanum verrucosum TaxID=315347 RepID=UPI0020D01A05|nr:geraniol 8-hydroxylase-like [Solanum verrucosum]
MFLSIIMDYYGLLGCGVVVVLGWTLIHVIRFYNKKKILLPPGPFSLPFIGNLHNLILGGDQPHTSFWRLAHKYGPIMTLKLGQKTTIVISSSLVAKEAFIKQDLALSSKIDKDALHAHGHNQFSVIFLPASSSRRKYLRKLLHSSIFSPNRLDASQHLRARKIEEFIAYCRQCSQYGTPVDIGQVASDTLVNIWSNTIFSEDLVDIYADPVKKFKHVIRYITYLIGKLNMVDYFPLLKGIDPQRINKNSFTTYEKLLRIFRGFIDQRLEQRNISTTVRSTNDFLDVLLNISEEEKKGDVNAILMDRNQIQHLCLDIFVSGSDSSSAVLEWAMLELMKNPETMKRAKAELAQVVGDENKTIEEKDVGRLPYLQCIVKETLRIHPPSSLLTRKAEQDVELCGYFVPKGSQVLVNVWAIGRDPDIWEDPLAFKPERFWDSINLDFHDNNFELIPFGVGRRMCVGLPLAIRAIPAMLGSLLNSFDWTLEENIAPKDLEEKFGLILAKSRPLRLVPIPLYSRRT